MYLLTDSPMVALDIWEKYGFRVFLWDTPENQDFEDTTFTRVKSMEEFAEGVKQDWDLWGERPDLRGNLQQEVEDALYQDGPTDDTSSSD